jgi:transaldolase/transaldolase/glucose-6-phosphate isomerase
VNTIPLATVNAFRDHGVAEARLERDADLAAVLLEQLPNLGIDLDAIARQLEDEGVARFNGPLDTLMESLAKRSHHYIKESE